MPPDIYNLNIESQSSLISPQELKDALPVNNHLANVIVGFRDEVSNIIHHDDERLLLIIGPCSIHDSDAALDYALRLKKLRDRYSDSMCIVMRVYFEKPRTSLGWRGLIVDPHLDGSYAIAEGLMKARKLLIDICTLGLPTGTEVLDPVVPQYIADLVSWSAIGARTAESQIHRELSSGLSMPVGFKNGTDGDMSKAANAVHSARHRHSFIGIDQTGSACIFRTRGNKSGHIILRGGSSGPNYYEKNIKGAESLLRRIDIRPSIIIDCSHENSGKNHALQSQVFHAALELRFQGYHSLRGVMLESNINPGKQELCEDKSMMRYGLSITDSCIGWDETEKLIGYSAREFAKMKLGSGT